MMHYNETSLNSHLITKLFTAINQFTECQSAHHLCLQGDRQTQTQTQREDAGSDFSAAETVIIFVLQQWEQQKELMKHMNTFIVRGCDSAGCRTRVCPPSDSLRDPAPPISLSLSVSEVTPGGKQEGGEAEFRLQGRAQSVTKMSTGAKKKTREIFINAMLETPYTITKWFLF